MCETCHMTNGIINLILNSHLSIQNTCWSRFCTVNCQPGLGFKTQTSEVGGECVTTLLPWPRLLYEGHITDFTDNLVSKSLTYDLL